VLCHAGAVIGELRERVGSERLGETLIRALETGALAPEPAPRALALQLQSAAFAGMVDRVFITEPWSWDLGPTVQVVYGILFRRT